MTTKFCGGLPQPKQERKKEKVSSSSKWLPPLPLLLLLLLLLISSRKRHRHPDPSQFCLNSPHGAPPLPLPPPDLAPTSLADGAAHRSPPLAAMIQSSHRTKVVVRHLPPSLPHTAFLEQIESRFVYNWVSFYPGKSSFKGSVYARAYIDFKHAEDVYEFYDSFNGHIFVNEKGTQYRALVEYAPYQRVPKPWCKKDVREGSISKDPEYLEFLELLAKPVEYLPSAEVQLERKEAERNSNLAAAGAKDAVIVTPLMEYVRQKRALKSAPQRLLVTPGKLSTRGGVSSPATSSSMASKRGSDRSRGSAMYLPSQVAMKLKEKSTYIPRRDENQRRDKELMIDKKRRDFVEVKDKKLLRDSTLPKVILSSQDMEASEDSGAINVKDFQETSPDPGAAAMDSNDMDQLGAHGHASGKVSLNFEVTNDPRKDGRDLSRKTLLLLKEKEKESSNGSVSNSLVLMTDSDCGPLKHHATAATKSPARALTAQQGLISPGRGGTLVSKPHQRRDGRRVGKAAPLMRDSTQQQQQQRVSVQELSQIDLQLDKDKRLPKPQILRANAKEFNTITVSGTSVSEFKLGPQVTNVGPTRFADDRNEIVHGPGIERHDERRVRNKDRPDRPVWTVRRRADVPAGSNSASFLASRSSSSLLVETDIVSGSHEINVQHEKNTTQFQNGLNLEQGAGEKGGEAPINSGQHGNFDWAIDSVSSSCGNMHAAKGCYMEGTRQNLGGSSSQDQASCQGNQKREVILFARSSDMKAQAVSKTTTVGHENGDSGSQSPILLSDKERRKQEAPAYWNELGGNQRQLRRDRIFQHGSRESDTSIQPDTSKPGKQRGGSSTYGGHEKQVWVAKSGSVS